MICLCLKTVKSISYVTTKCFLPSRGHRLALNAENVRNNVHSIFRSKRSWKWSTEPYFGKSRLKKSVGNPLAVMTLPHCSTRTIASFCYKSSLSVISKRLRFDLHIFHWDAWFLPFIVDLQDCLRVKTCVLVIEGHSLLSPAQIQSFMQTILMRMNSIQ